MASSLPGGGGGGNDIANEGVGSVLLTSLDDPGPLLTSAEAAALHDRQEAVAWFAVPAPGGAGVIARAHTEAHDDGRLLPGYLAAANLAALQTLMPPGLTFNPVLVVGSPPGCLGWWWS